jgi:hypothetical protein
VGVVGDEANEQTQLHVVPNPARDEITVVHSSSSNAVIELIDVLGNVVALSHQQKIDIHDLADGVYCVRVQSSKEILQQMFMVAR